jgi:hypothetical protein
VLVGCAVCAAAVPANARPPMTRATDEISTVQLRR